MADIDEANIDPYLHLGLNPQATEKDIKSAYRKKSLILHPDKNPDNPKAAHEFHLLSLSYALLLDGPRRAALDIKLEAKRARAARTAGLESRKRGMVNDLVAREEAFKKVKQEQTAHAHANQAEASVQSEGKRMREAAEAAQFAAQQFARMEENRIHTASLNARAAEKEATSSHDSIPDLQRTLRLSLPLPQSAAIISSTDSLLAYLLPTYGHISDCVILPPKAAKKKSSKGGAGDVFKEQASAMMVFGKDNLGGCWALWEDCRVGRGRVKGWKAKWAEGGVEPEWVARLGGTLQQPAPSPSSQPSSSTSKISSNSASSTSEASSAPTFSFDPSAPPPTSTSFPPPPKFSAPGPSEADYESATLLRMRQAERERLEREIREADEMED